MRTALTLSLVAVLALTGCASEPPVVLPSEEPSGSPVFGSDEEALAAAEEALTAYYAVSDQIFADGGSTPDRILEVATQEIADREAVGYAQMVDRVWHGVGATTLDSIQLQSFDLSASDGEEVVSIYVCVDTSGLDIVDASGASVVVPSRVTRTPFEAGFAFAGSEAGTLVLSRKDAWTGDDFCVV